MCNGSPKRINKAIKQDGEKAEWELQHEIADSRSPIIRVDFGKAVEEIKNELSEEDLAIAINAGSSTKVFAQIKFTKQAFKSLDSTVEDIVHSSAKNSERFMPVISQDEIYNPKNKSIKSWVDFYSSQRLQQMDEQTRKVVKNVLRQKKTENLTTAQTAKRLRESIGLNSVQAKALDNLEKSLIKSGKTEKQIEKAKEKYTKKAIKYRASMIAETEAIDAVNYGQLEVWQQALEQGLFDPNRMVKQWFVTPDDKLCDYCKGMDGQQRNINEKFVDPTGTFRPVYSPTLHPKCRCVMILTRKREE